MGFWRKMPREARLMGDLTLGEAYQGDPDRGTKPWPWPFNNNLASVVVCLYTGGYP